MTAKLHINISQGVLDIEGDPELVREIYADFKDQLLAGGTERIQPPEKLEEHDKTPEALKSRIRTRRKTSSRKRAKSDEAGSDISADAPNLDRELDTSKLALFYGKYKPTNHPEKVLIFLMFLSEELGIESPNTD